METETISNLVVNTCMPRVKQMARNVGKHILPPQSDPIKNNLLMNTNQISTLFKDGNAEQDKVEGLDHTFCF